MKCCPRIATIPVYGYLYDVKSGALVEVPEATEIGAAEG
jgi:carbonic anhydrase